MSETRGTWRVQLTARRTAELLGDWESGGSVYRALADRLRLLIVDGRIQAGTRLPSERDLAAELDRSRSTVVAGYNLLRVDGYARSVQGSGTVTALPTAPRRPAAAGAALDFAHAVPPPIAGLEDLLARALADASSVLARPGFDMLGDPVLRERIARRFETRGLPTEAAQVMVTLGAQHAIHLLARLLVRPGDRVLMEAPLYPHAYEAFRAAGARVVTTPVTREGWDGDHLLAVLERYRPTAAYLLPDFHNPTGASMAPALRAEVVRVADRVGTTLVIDETTAELAIDRAWDDGPFGGYGEGVVTIGSLSKTMWSGLRIGWIRASAEVVDRLSLLRPAFDLGTPHLEQLVAAELVPRLGELLPLRAAQLREGRETLRRLLGAALPSWEVPDVDGGLSLWVGLGQPVSSSLAWVAQTRGLLLSAGPRFSLDGSYERFVRLPFTAPAEELAAGVAVLAQAWETLGTAAPPAASHRVPGVV